MHFPQMWQSVAGTSGPSGEQAVHQESRCAEIWLQQELSWMQIGDDEHDGTCAL